MRRPLVRAGVRLNGPERFSPGLARAVRILHVSGESVLYPWIRRVVCKAHDVRHDREIANTVSIPIRVLARARTLSEGASQTQRDQDDPPRR